MTCKTIEGDPQEATAKWNLRLPAPEAGENASGGLK